MLIQPAIKAVPFHTLPPGKIVSILDHEGPRLGLTIEAIHGGSNCDVVLLPSPKSEPASNYAAWDATAFETSPAIVFEDPICLIDTTSDQVVYDRNIEPREGFVYLIEDRLALCSYYPQQGPKVRFLHWFDDGKRARPRTANAVAFPKWSIITPSKDAPPLVLFSS